MTNYCREGTCPDYFGPTGTTTKAEFALQEGGLDFYDVSVIDGYVADPRIGKVNIREFRKIELESK